MGADVFKFEIDQKALDAFMEELNKLAPEVAQRVFQKAMKSGSEKLQNKMKQNLSMTKGTGRLANAIKIRNVTKYRPFFWKSSIEVPRGKKKDDPKGAYYAHLVERGHFVGKSNKTYVGPNPFMQNAAKELESQIRNEFTQDLRSELNKQWARIAKRTKAKK